MVTEPVATVKPVNRFGVKRKENRQAYFYFFFVPRAF